MFAGEYFLPETTCCPSEVPYQSGGIIFPGRLYHWNGDPLYKAMVNQYGPSRQYSIIFNVFVWMQIFNMVNARKINDERNVCEGFFKNKMFLIILLAISGIQVIIVQFTREVFQVAIPGIAWFHWLICWAIGLTVFPMALLMKCVPDRICPEIGKKKRAFKDEGVLNLRRKRTQSLSQRGVKDIGQGPGSKQGSGM